MLRAGPLRRRDAALCGGSGAAGRGSPPRSPSRLRAVTKNWPANQQTRCSHHRRLLIQQATETSAPKTEMPKMPKTLRLGRCQCDPAIVSDLRGTGGEAARVTQATVLSPQSRSHPVTLKRSGAVATPGLTSWTEDDVPRSYQPGVSDPWLRLPGRRRADAVYRCGRSAVPVVTATP